MSEPSKADVLRRRRNEPVRGGIKPETGNLGPNPGRGKCRHHEPSEAGRVLAGCLSLKVRFRKNQIIGTSNTFVDRFLIESPHEPGECKKIVKNVYAQGYLYNCDWGCKGGVHKAWVIIEAENEQQALWVVPPILRSNATAVKLVKFDPEIVKEWEE